MADVRSNYTLCLGDNYTYSSQSYCTEMNANVTLDVR